MEKKTPMSWIYDIRKLIFQLWRWGCKDLNLQVWTMFRSGWNTKLKGRAFQWHQIILKIKLGRLLNWDDYLRDLTLRFSHKMKDDPMSKLIALKQEDSVQKYIEKFDELLNHVNLSEEYFISCFLHSVKLEMKVQIRMLAPCTLMKTYS